MTMKHTTTQVGGPSTVTTEPSAAGNVWLVLEDRVTDPDGKVVFHTAYMDPAEAESVARGLLNAAAEARSRAATQEWSVAKVASHLDAKGYQGS